MREHTSYGDLENAEVIVATSGDERLARLIDCPCSYEQDTAG